MKVESKEFGGLFDFLSKSGLKASDGSPQGEFPFFTSSPEQKKWTDSAVYRVEALVFGTGGSASVHHVDVPFSTSSDCLVATAKQPGQLSSRFCYHYLQWNIRAIEAGFRGVGLKHVSKSHIEEIVLPIPPLAEQRRSAEELDRAEALRAKRRAALAQLDSLTQSLFLDLFGDPATSAQKFPTARLGAVTAFIDYRGISPNKQPNGVRLVTARNIKRGWFESEPQEFIPAEEYESWMTRGMPRAGDVLFTTEGHTLGSAALLPRFE